MANNKFNTKKNTFKRKHQKKTKKNNKKRNIKQKGGSNRYSPSYSWSTNQYGQDRQYSEHRQRQIEQILPRSVISGVIHNIQPDSNLSLLGKSMSEIIRLLNKDQHLIAKLKTEFLDNFNTNSGILNNAKAEASLAAPTAPATEAPATEAQEEEVGTEVTLAQETEATEAQATEAAPETTASIYETNIPGPPPPAAASVDGPAAATVDGPGSGTQRGEATAFGEELETEWSKKINTLEKMINNSVKGRTTKTPSNKINNKKEIDYQIEILETLLRKMDQADFDRGNYKKRK